MTSRPRSTDTRTSAHPLEMICLLWHEHGFENEDSWVDQKMLKTLIDTVEPAIVTVGLLVRESLSHYYVSVAVHPNGDFVTPWAVAKGACTKVTRMPFAP